MAKSDGRLKRFFLPTIEDAGSARKAARQGACIAVVIGIVTAAITTLAVTGVTNLFGLDAYSYADAVIFLLLGFFIFRMSRAAAILALGLYIGEQVLQLLDAGGKSGGGGIVLGFLFVNSVRGTLAYHRFVKEAIAANPVPDEPAPYKRHRIRDSRSNGY
jgi:hypothetical protein